MVRLLFFHDGIDRCRSGLVLALKFFQLMFEVPENDALHGHGGGCDGGFSKKACCHTQDEST